MAPTSDRPTIAFSTLQLPAGAWVSALDCLADHFPAIGREVWRERIEGGRVLDADGVAIRLDAPYRRGATIRYRREVVDEIAVPFVETILHADAHLVVADKPHFLPVLPSGRHVEHTLLTRLRRRLGEPDLVPLHRLDRDTAGLVLFSRDPASRDVYQALFRERRIEKHYEAYAPALPHLAFPLPRASRIVRGEPFFRSMEVPGEPNSLTAIDVLERADGSWRYSLRPVSGRKHQLRVHMAALGAPIDNDVLYPELRPRAADDFGAPLKLLAKRLRFIDPLDGSAREFCSGCEL